MLDDKIALLTQNQIHHPLKTPLRILYSIRGREKISDLLFRPSRRGMKKGKRGDENAILHLKNAALWLHPTLTSMIL
jgi:hypothetical protein